MVADRGAQQMQRSWGSNVAHQHCRVLFATHLERRYENALGRLLDTRQRGWHPDITVEGAGHLNHALSRGKGAILWGMSFCGPVVPKMGMLHRGVAVTHLSTSHHPGFSETLAAIHVLNRWATKSENKYLSERVIVPSGGSRAGLMGLLEQRLQNNACLSIVGDHRVKTGIEVACLGTRRRFGTGAPRLAQSTQAELLTLYSYQTGPFRYRVIIESPIDMQTGREGQRAAVSQFAARLERHVKSHPADWDEWANAAP